jgi:hypothetical protein
MVLIVINYEAFLRSFHVKSEPKTEFFNDSEPNRPSFLKAELNRN